MPTSAPAPNVISVIPARMASTRYPGKPLATILGMPMIAHVYHRTCLASRTGTVYVATCDEEIRAYSAQAGIPCVMTASSHERASDRACEAMLTIERTTGRRVDVVMMVQGDEPLVDPRSLDECLEIMLAEPSAPVVNLMTDVQDEHDFTSTNVVKVVVGLASQALYFSREPIPSRWHGLPRTRLLKQLGLIAFRRDFLERFSALPPGPLEIIESVDMLRVLEHGESIRMVATQHQSLGVDTPADLDRATALMRDDPYVARYCPR